MNRPGLRQIEHPVVADRLRILRDHATDREQFCSTIEQLSFLLAAEATASLQTASMAVQTPLEKTQAQRIAHSILLVPVLRAGVGMLHAFQHLLPEAAVAFFGAARDEKTLKPAIYLDKIPRVTKSSEVFVLDPMLATGRSACAVLERLREQGASLNRTRLVCCLAAPEGVAVVSSRYPEVAIIAAAVDRQLNPKGFILPGLGDAGDRQFGG